MTKLHYYDILQLLSFIIIIAIMLYICYKNNKTKKLIDHFDMYYNHPLRDVKDLHKYFKKNKHPHSVNKNIKNKPNLKNEMTYIKKILQ